jgi:hypothetical protein
VSDASVTEPLSGTATATFTVSLSAPTTQPVSVDYRTIDGTATAPGDYLPVSGTIELAPGDTSATVAVTVLADDQNEVTEQYSLELAAPVNATVADGSGRGRIITGVTTEPDAPGAPTVIVGNQPGQARVRWVEPPDGGVAISAYHVLRGTTPGNLTEIAATDGSTTTFVDNNTSNTDAHLYYAVVATNSIGNSQPSAVTAFSPVSLTVSDTTVLEPAVATPAVTGRVRFLLSQPAASDVKIRYHTVADSATSADYKPKGTAVKPLTATIKAGRVMAAATVVIRDDAIAELDEQLTVHVDSVTPVAAGAVTVADADGTITIRDSDSLAGADPVLVVTDARVVEGGVGAPRTVQLLAQLDRPLATDTFLKWRTVDGTATAPGDYVAKGTPTKLVTVKIGAGKLFAVLTVTVKADADTEGDESLTVPVTVSTGGPVTVVDGTGTLTLVDDD